jgi:hypothetical protein
MNIKKIILISLFGIILVVIGYIAYTFLTTRSHSPADRVEYSDGDFQLSIDYCRPYKKGRIIFGEESEGALLPYGKYWRTGANEATEIVFNRDINIKGNTLNAGRYRFYTIPAKDTWTVAFNSELGKWGYGEPNYEMDVLRTEIPAGQLDQSLEQFTISGVREGENAMNIVLAWDQTQVKIPVQY